MAEPFAAAVFAEETKAKDYFEVDLQGYKPSWTRGANGNTHFVQADEDAKQKAAEDTGFLESAKTAFLTGDNFAIQLAKDLERIHAGGPDDPEWDVQKGDWIKLNQKRIGEQNNWRYNQVRNRNEAELLLADQETNAVGQDTLARRGGFSTFVAQGMAGLIDLDTPISMMTGGLSATAKLGINATKIGRLATGAATGAIAAGGAGAVDYASDPNSDWTIIPATGLMGAVFGGAMGIHARAPVNLADEARIKALDEFGETVNDGIPRAKEDLRYETFEDTDVYGSDRADRMEAAAAADIEAAVMEKAADSDLAGLGTPRSDNFDLAAERDIQDAVLREAAINDVRQAVMNKAAEQDIAISKAADQDQSALDIKEASSDVPEHTVSPEGRSSIGARQLGNTGPGLASIRNARIQTMVQGAKTWAQQSGVPTEWLDGWGNLQGKRAAVGRQAERFHNFLSNSPLATDYARMMNSGSAVAQRFAYDMMENASGIIRNSRSGARLLDHYQKGMLQSFEPFENNFADWAGRVHNMGFVRRNWDTTARNDFNRLVTEEMQSRRYSGAGVQNQDAAVKAAADALDDTFRKEVEITQGRPNEGSVAGSEHLTVQSGYMPQKWLGRNMMNLINTGGFTRKDIVNAIAEGYQQLHPAMKGTDAQIYADAVVGRAEKFDQGINTSLIGMLAADGRTELADVLTRNGMPAHEIDRFIDRLTGAMEVKGSPGHTKARVDIDLRFTASNGVNIMDLVDTDFASMVPKRVRRSAGQAALARKGIRSRQDWDAVKDAIIAEQTANGKSAPTGTSPLDRARDYIDSDKHLDTETLDNMYTYFNGDPVAGGISPVYSRMKKLTNLALLNQLGLTQLAEFGVNIASVGIQQFYRHAGKEITDSLKKVDSPLVQELKHMSIFVPEENLFRDDLVHEFEKHTATSEYMRNFDRLLNKAQRVQGFTSGFYAMRKIQQRIAVTSAADKLARHFKEGGIISDPRLRDMGLDVAEIRSLKQYVDNGTVQFDAQGNLASLNFRQWAPEDVELFALTMNASTNTLVQKAMIGESSMLFHKDGVASLFWHLKSFPMLAIEKQLLRQSRIMDTETAMTFMYGLATASAAYTARQVVNGRTENLTFDKISRGAFGYSNMTGWIPMWTDPLAGMLGMDNLKIGGYGGHGGNQVISTPAAFGTLDRMIQAPAAAVHSVLNMGPTKADINALTATPLIGNAYGFAFIFNQLR